MRKSVTFQSNGLALKGDLYVPDDYRAGQKLPAVVVSHPFGGVKEQTAGLYAQKLCLVDGATHIDLYDKPEYVTPAVERLDAFFDKYLAPA